MGAKDTFFTLGLLDENTFLYLEEAILAHKAHSAGLRNYLITSTSYDHAEAKTISSILSHSTMRNHLIKSRLYFHQHYLGTPWLWRQVLTALLLIWEVENFFYQLIRRIFDR